MRADQSCGTPKPARYMTARLCTALVYDFDDSTGRFWHAADVFQWMDWNPPQAQSATT
jgi:hypothetical protein